MEDFSLDAMSNPALIEKRILDGYEEYVTKGEAVVVDPNNTFMFLVEMFSQLNSDSIQAILNKFNALYPQRALTPEDLYMHMSDYDYVNLFGSPASIDMEIILGKQELIDNAVPINGITTYRKIVIPKSTVFTVGDYVFGLHYPIEIRINNITKSFTVVYDTSEDAESLHSVNPFIQLSRDTVDYAFQSYKDIDIVALRFPVYQFQKTEILTDTSSTSGFRNTISFDNLFYAMRIFHSVNGSWVEMQQTLSDTVYDPMTPTAKLMVDTENHNVTVTIPQVYFTSGLISGQIKFELYTTLGELDVDITNISMEQVAATFSGTTTQTTLDEYSRPLDRAQTIQVYPISTKIVGGTNGYTFEELRTRVINNTFYSKVIRYAELESKLQSEGFGISKYQDSIMNRIFFCTKDITDMNGETIASGNIQLHIPSTIVSSIENGSQIPPDYRWLRYHASDSSLMILPQAMMKYDPEYNVSTLVPNSEYPELKDTPDKRAAAYNSAQYTFQPFHLKVTMSNRYPVAYSYNLMSPSVDRILFNGNNAAIGQTINAFTGAIIHNNAGSGGYTLRMAVTLSDDLVAAIENIDTIDVDGASTYKQDIWPYDIIAYLKYSKDTEVTDGCYAILTPVADKMEDKYLFELQLDTSYFINKNHYIQFDPVRQLDLGAKTSPAYSQGRIASGGMVPIQSGDWTLTFLIKKDKLKYIAPPKGDEPVPELEDDEIRNYVNGAVDANIGVLAMTELGEDYVPIAEQKLTLNFGYYVSQVFNDTEVFTGDREYQTYAETRYLVNGSDVFLRDSNNILLQTSNVENSTMGEYVRFQIASQARDYVLNSPNVLPFSVDSVEVREFNLKYADTSDPTYYKVLNNDEEYAYELYSDTDLLTVTDVDLDKVILDGSKPVTISNTNLEKYIGKTYKMLVPVMVRHIVLHSPEDLISDTSNNPVHAGDALVEAPTINGVTKMFSPGLTVDSVEAAIGGGTEIVLQNKIINKDHVLAPVESLNYMVTYYAKQMEEVDIPGLDTPDTQSETGVHAATAMLTQVFTNYLNDFYPYSSDEDKKLYFKAGTPLIAHHAGDVILDANQQPTIAGDRTLEYYVTCIQMDARAFVMEDVTPSEMRVAISKMITDYVAIVDKYKPQLLENTHLYYQPTRSIGNAQFSMGNDVLKHLPLQIATEFTLTVKSFVLEDDNIKDVIQKRILEFVNSSILDSTISVTVISNMIIEELSDYVEAVSVSGFITKEDLSTSLTSDEKMDAFNTQVLKVVEEDTKLSVRRLVYKTDRDLLNTKRCLTINFVV